jgi:hypothetical protein
MLDGRVSVSVVPLAALLVATGCAQTPVAPEPAGFTSGKSAASLAASAPFTTFPLMAGTFAMTAASGTMTGTYTGRTEGTDERVALLDLAMTGGTGAFGGAAGTPKGIGSGAYAGEGNFFLSFQGPVSTSAALITVHVTLAGTSTVSCNAGHILVTQRGTGTAGTFGPVSTVFAHEVGNASCTD